MLTIRKIETSFLDWLGEDYAVVVYFSGCTLKCEECHSKDLQEIYAYDEINTFDLFCQLIEKCENEDTDKVVLLGGEPLQQNLEHLQKLIRLLRINGIEIGLYTGYSEKEARERLGNCLTNLSWIKVGKYDRELFQTPFKKVDGDIILASKNQKFIKIGE